MTKHTQLESILFVASKPLSFRELAHALSSDVETISALVSDMVRTWNVAERGIHVFVDGDRVQMSTNPGAADVVAGFIKAEVSEDLTKAQLETLTVIAYCAPVTRPELEDIRGVNCAVILRNLEMRGLVESDEEDIPGVPIYRLSFDALRTLGIRNVSELPDYEMLHSHAHIEVARGSEPVNN